jgi:SNF2 family DNA or RNA helicase
VVDRRQGGSSYRPRAQDREKQAVQVFKLISEGTLEEKISAIIERKRKLMSDVVQVDNPQLSKIFTREELGIFSSLAGNKNNKSPFTNHQ